MSVVSADPTPPIGEAVDTPPPETPLQAGNSAGGRKAAVARAPPPPAAQLVENRRLLLQQTWALVERDLDDRLAYRFYERLFAKYPETRHLFGDDISVELQARKLHEVLRVAVKMLDRQHPVEDLLPSLREMGARHARVYGVRRHHYRAVTEVFIEVLNEHLDAALRPVVGDSLVLWRLDVAAAWGWMLTWIGNAMADGGDESTPSSDSRRGDSPSHGQ